jgi:small subunit ribosomal protein S8
MSNIVSSDPVADMLTRIRNAAAVRKHEIRLPHSQLKEAVARLLKDSNFIDDVKVEGEKSTKALVLVLNSERENAHITEIVRLSRPGARQYVGAGEIPTVKGGRGIVIVSTSKGLMTGTDARKQSLGGELICTVY